MTLHLIKLCVGATSVDDHKAWIDYCAAQSKLMGKKHEQFHTTRMYPKRADEIVGKGSLYWVIKGQVQCRQRILDLRRFKDHDGVGRCKIVLEPLVQLTALQPKRPFQGWRYFKAEDAPADILHNEADGEPMSAEMARELSELGLL